MQAPGAMPRIATSPGSSLFSGVFSKRRVNARMHLPMSNASPELLLTRGTFRWQSKTLILSMNVDQK